MYRRCKICQKFFDALTKKTIYCLKCRGTKKYYVPKEKIKKECVYPYCKKVYTSCRDNQQFCSDICKNKFHEMQRMRIWKICLRCKKNFQTTNSSRKYCKNECYLIAKKMRDEIAYQKRRVL